MKAKTEPPKPLSPRQRDIITLIARGEGDKAIAERFLCSIDTVNSQLRRAFEKLGARSRAHAVYIFFVTRSGDTGIGDSRRISRGRKVIA